MREKVFTTGEVAVICGVSADTVSRWFDLGQIEGYRLGAGGDRRIPFEMLRKFMLGHGIPLERLEKDERRVLVIDDDPHYLDMFQAALEEADEFEVAVASTAFDAGAKVVDFNPHVIVMDLHLSDMSARVVCERVKARPETKATAFIGLSRYPDASGSFQLEDMNLDALLSKPLEGNEVREHVRRLFEKPKLRKARARPLPPGRA